MVILAFIKEIRITILEIRCTWGKSVKILDNLKNCAKTGSVNLSFQKGTCLLISLLPLLVIKSPPFFIPFSSTLIINQYSGTNDIPQQLELKGCNLLVTLCFASTRFCKFRGKNGMDTRKKKDSYQSLVHFSSSNVIYKNIPWWCSKSYGINNWICHIFCSLLLLPSLNNLTNNKNALF